MGERELRLHPFQSMAAERKLAKKRRGNAERVHRRTDVVQKTGQRKFSRSYPATDGVTGLQQQHFSLGLRQTDRRCETVWARTHHHRVIGFCFQTLCLIDHHELIRNVTRPSG